MKFKNYEEEEDDTMSRKLDVDSASIAELDHPYRFR